MSRERILYDSKGKLAEYVDDELVWLRPGVNTNASSGSGPMIMRDIQPYKSMINGQMISSRSEHRNHLKQHNCVEVGNDTSHMKPKDRVFDFKTRKKVLASQFADLNDRQVSKLIKAEIKARKH